MKTFEISLFLGHMVVKFNIEELRIGTKACEKNESFFLFGTNINPKML